MAGWRRLATGAALVLALLTIAAGLAAGLAACGTTEADLIQTLKTATADTDRKDAAATLARLHSLAATNELKAAGAAGGAAADGLSALRDQSIALLGQTVTKYSVPGDTVPAQTVAALERVMDCLAAIGDSQSISALGGQVIDPERAKAGAPLIDEYSFPDLGDLQLYALDLLTKLKDEPGALDQLVQAATLVGSMDSTAGIREVAANTLAVTPEAVAPLIKARKASADEEVLAAIDGILTGIGQPAVEPLVALLGTESWAEVVLRSLGADAVGPVSTLLADSDPDVRYAALGVLLGIHTDGEASATDRLAEAEMIPLLIEARQQAVYDADQYAALEGVFSSIGEPAVAPLMALLSTESWAPAALAGIGAPAVPKLMEALKSKDQNVRFGAADSLVLIQKADPALVSDLMAALEESDTKFIAGNYPFYIRLGLAGTEDTLSRALDKNGTKDMCVDYLNCGNDKLAMAAESWAHKHGYTVITTPGSHNGPQWGEGV
jgi:hypothetical protein